MCLCRKRLAGEGWTESEVYADFALSGSTMNRPGLAELLGDAAGGAFDLVVGESIDRLSRDQVNMAGFFKRLSFAGADIVTLIEGEVSELHIGLKSTMSQIYLKDLAARVRRGQAGAVKRGKVLGGLRYGYATDARVTAEGALERGRRRIVKEVAGVVCRIFRDYAAGHSPRAIAKRLNEQGVPAPPLARQRHRRQCRQGQWRPP